MLLLEAQILERETLVALRNKRLASSEVLIPDHVVSWCLWLGFCDPQTKSSAKWGKVCSLF